MARVVSNSGQNGPGGLFCYDSRKGALTVFESWGSFGLWFKDECNSFVFGDVVMGKTKMPHAGHDKHLCYLNNLGFQISNPDDYKALVIDGKFVCKVCGRVSADKKNLCKPVKL